MKSNNKYLISGALALGGLWIGATGAHYGPAWTEFPFVATGALLAWAGLVLPIWWNDR